MRKIRQLAAAAFDRAMAANIDNIVTLLEHDPSAVLLDVGCDDGELTMQLARAVGTTSVHGVEVVEGRASLARSRGVAVSATDLNQGLPYHDGAFDVVCGNQVIEHLADTDRFVAEIFRVLRPGGYAILSTENLASWHNVVALVFGWQPFSLTNVTSTRMGLGNPLAVHRHSNWEHGETWQHRRVFAFQGLRELLKAHAFDVEQTLGAGYYPLPCRVARIYSRHAAFLAVKARRPR